MAAALTISTRSEAGSQISVILRHDPAEVAERAPRDAEPWSYEAADPSAEPGGAVHRQRGKEGHEQQQQHGLDQIEEPAARRPRWAHPAFEWAIELMGALAPLSPLAFLIRLLQPLEPAFWQVIGAIGARPSMSAPAIERSLLCSRTLTATLGLPFSLAFVRTHLGAGFERLFHFRSRISIADTRLAPPAQHEALRLAAAPALPRERHQPAAASFSRAAISSAASISTK